MNTDHIGSTEAEIRKMMGVRRGRRERRVGWILLILFAIAVAIPLLRGSELGRRRAGILLYTEIDRGYRLSKGSPVLMADVRVGEIDSLTMEHRPLKIHAAIRVYPEFSTSVPKGTILTIGTENIIEPAAILLLPSDTDALYLSSLADGDSIPFLPGTDIVASMQEAMNRVSNELEMVLVNIRKLTEDLSDTASGVSVMMRDLQRGSKDMRIAAGNVRSATQNPRTMVGMILQDTSVARNVRETASNVRAITDTAARFYTNIEIASEKLPALMERADTLVIRTDSAVEEARGLISKIGGSWLLGGNQKRSRDPNSY